MKRNRTFIVTKRKDSAAARGYLNYLNVPKGGEKLTDWCAMEALLTAPDGEGAEARGSVDQRILNNNKIFFPLLEVRCCLLVSRGPVC